MQFKKKFFASDNLHDKIFSHLRKLNLCEILKTLNVNELNRNICNLLVKYLLKSFRQFINCIIIKNINCFDTSLSLRRHRCIKFFNDV